MSHSRKKKTEWVKYCAKTQQNGFQKEDVCARVQCSCTSGAAIIVRVLVFSLSCSYRSPLQPLWHHEFISKKKEAQACLFFPFLLLFFIDRLRWTQKWGMDNTEGGASSYIIEYLLLFVVRITDVAIRFWQKKSKPKELKQGENMASPGDVADVLWRQSPSVPGWESVCACVCVLGQRGWTCRWGQDFFFF